MTVSRLRNSRSAASAGVLAAMGRGYTYDADAEAYIAAVEAADGDRLEYGVRQAISQFVAGCKTDGIWSAIKAACVLCGARTLSGALTPLVGSGPTNNNFVSGDYSRTLGLLGNGSTKYLNTNRAGNADPQNSFHASVFVSTLTTSGVLPVRVLLASSNTGGTIKNVGLFHYANSYYFNARRDSGNFTQAGAQFAATGFIGVRRTSSTAVRGRALNNNYDGTVTSQTPSADNIAVYAANAGGTISDYSNGRIAYYSIGESLDLAQLETRVSALYYSIGAALS